MTEAMPFLQKYDITFLRPPTIFGGEFFVVFVKDIVQHLFPIELFDLVEVAFFHQGPASGASNQKKQNQKKQTEQGLYL